MPVITTIRLSRDHQRLGSDIRTLHAYIEAGLGHAADRPDDASRTLWAQPVKDLLIVQAWRAVDPSYWLGSHLRHAPAATEWGHGQRVRLSLIGNPVSRRSIKRDGKRVSIELANVPIDKHADWLQSRLPSVELEAVEVQQLGKRTGSKPGRRITVTQAGFHATGTVTDPAGLAEAIRCGVGRQRAYGCGLLLVGAA